MTQSTYRRPFHRGQWREPQQYCAAQCRRQYRQRLSKRTSRGRGCLRSSIGPKRTQKRSSSIKWQYQMRETPLASIQARRSRAAAQGNGRTPQIPPPTPRQARPLFGWGSRLVFHLRGQRHLDALNRIALGIVEPDRTQSSASFIHHFEY